jgi:murein DD-endopeptidase MepM/ murein hydrolase activator NlpD
MDTVGSVFGVKRECRLSGGTMITCSFSSQLSHYRLSLHANFAQVTLAVLAAVMLIMPSPVAANNLQKVNKLAQECSSGRQKACSELAKIAVEEKDASVRGAAAAELTDQSLLAKIALEDTDAGVRGAAAKGLTEPSLLAKLAMESPDSSERKNAVAKVNDQALLDTIAQEAKDGEARNSAVSKLADQALLTKIEAADEDKSVREAAGKRLAELASLAKIAVEGEDVTARIAAVEKLYDQALLAKIAADDTDNSVREAADITLASLQTVNLPYEQRVAVNWPKLHTHLDIKYVLKLIGPLPPDCDWSESIKGRGTQIALSGSATQHLWPNILRTSDPDTQVIVNFRTRLFDLTFDNGLLASFSRKAR